MKVGDLVMMNKHDIWEPPYDIPGGTIGLIIDVFNCDNHGNPHSDVGVMFNGRRRLILKHFLRVIETEKSSKECVQSSQSELKDLIKEE